jgi:hypothetical protein
MEEDDANPIGDAWGAAQGVQADNRPDPLLRRRIDQLGRDDAGSGERPLPAGIPAPHAPTTCDLARALEQVITGGIQSEADLLVGINQSHVNHDVERTLSQSHVDPVAPVRSRSPESLRHGAHL